MNYLCIVELSARSAHTKKQLWTLSCVNHTGYIEEWVFYRYQQKVSFLKWKDFPLNQVLGINVQNVCNIHNCHYVYIINLYICIHKTHVTCIMYLYTYIHVAKTSAHIYTISIYETDIIQAWINDWLQSAIIIII